MENLYQQAITFAKAETAEIKDTGYGCGSSFITIKGNTAFARWAKKQGLTKRDAYYGNILNTQDFFTGTLEQEAYDRAFAKYLNENGILAFAHCLVN